MKLSKSMQEVYTLLIEGNNAASIAEKRGTSRESEKMRIKRLYKYLGVHSKEELIRRHYNFD